MSRSRLAALAAVFAALVLTGCSGSTAKPGAAATPPSATDGVAAERAKLSPEDRAVADAQEWCAVSTDERLGAMGPPLKLDIQGRPVFVCCKGCKRKAEADAEKTLKTVDELKAKKAAGSSR